MPQILELTPAAGASTNDYDITFGSSASIEFIAVPEKILNKTLTGVELTEINALGIVVTKASLKALIPWSNISNLIY